MIGNIAAVGLLALLAWGFYTFLNHGAGTVIVDTFITAPTATASIPEDPPAAATAPPKLVPTPTAVPPVTQGQPVSSSPEPEQNRLDCHAIRGTQYLSPGERSWFLANCLAEQNRASCDAIRGTQYLSPGERSWYLANCR